MGQINVKGAQKPCLNVHWLKGGPNGWIPPKHVFKEMILVGTLLKNLNMARMKSLQSHNDFWRGWS